MSKEKRNDVCTENEEYMIETITNKFKRSTRVAFLSTLIWGVLAHGMALFNKFSFHDDLENFYGVGNTYVLGRWMLGVCDDLGKKIFGSTHFSMPLFNGLWTILAIAVAVSLLIELLEIKNEWLIVLLSCVMVAFPSVTSLFGYIFTAPYYAMAILGSITGVYLLEKCRKWYGFLGGIVLIGASVGIYQAYIPVAITVMLLVFIQKSLKAGRTWKSYWLDALYYVLVCGAFLLFYVAMNQLFLAIQGISMSGYQGLSNMGDATVMTYINRIGVAYAEFFAPKADLRTNMFPMALGKYRYVAIAVVFVLLVRKAITVLKASSATKLGTVNEENVEGVKGVSRLVQILLPTLVFPMAADFIYVMCDREISYIYGIMLYSQCLLFAFLVITIQDILDGCACSQGDVMTSDEKATSKKTGNAVAKCATILGAVLFLLMDIVFLHHDNATYLKADIMRSEATSYFTTLVTRIKSVEGYDDSLPVVYLNEFKKSDESFTNMGELDQMQVAPFWYRGNATVLNDSGWQGYMRIWVGYAPTIGDANALAEEPEVQAMPSYPDEGSIRVVDGTVVVKF